MTTAIQPKSSQDMQVAAIRSELMEIAKDHGVLTPELVVEKARDPNTALHAKFEWNESDGHYKFLLMQAMQLLRVIKVTIVRENRDTKQIEVKTTRAFVAPISERKSKLNPGGGYSPVEDVLSDPDRRQALLDTALSELTAFRQKYESLDELAAIWTALDKLSKPRRGKAGK